jgi:hypothetical protein
MFPVFLPLLVVLAVAFLVWGLLPYVIIWLCIMAVVWTWTKITGG